MLPLPVQRRVDHFEAVAKNLRDTADEHPDRPAAAKRFMQAAQTIDEACALIRLANWQAKLNHDVIVARATP